jgi:hypothetical protein
MAASPHLKGCNETLLLDMTKSKDEYAKALKGKTPLQGRADLKDERV